MKNGLPYYKAYPADFLRGTVGMGLEEKGAYRILLDLIYQQGGELADDPHYISGNLGCSVRKWKTIREKLISRGKIVAENGIISNFRARKELEKLSEYQDNQAENRRGSSKNNNLKKPACVYNQISDIKKKDIPPVSPPSGDKPQKRKHRLPDDFVLTLGMAQTAERHGMARNDVAREFEAFRAHHGGKGNLMVDWEKAWVTWCCNSKRFNGGGRGPPKKNPFVSRTTQAIAGTLEFYRNEGKDR